MRRSIGFILKSLLASMLPVGMALILAASTASAYTPNDPYWGSQWGPNKIYAPDAWNYQKGSTTITVAILDTGIDYNHEDLSGRVIQGWNFYNNSNAVMDDNSDSHGTRIAGISGAVINNNKGIAGIAQTNLLAVKVCNFMQNCTWPAITDGIYYAANNGSKIISMSLQKDEYSSNAETAVDYAYNNKGALLVGISGNGFYGTGENIIKYPGNFSNVIAVGATDSNDQKASFSNYGSKLELVAPGDNIFSTTRNNGYAGDVGDRKNGSGTSYAAPHVAGVAALVWSQYPTLSNSEVRQILTSTAVDLGDAGRDIYYGYGKVNASRAVSYLPGWGYRKQKTITGSTAGAQTNYQMKLTVYKGSGTDSLGVVYLGGNVRDDFGDLRFTKSDGVTLLDYWIESYTSGVSAVVWVKVDSIPASPNTADIYIYYGNPSATSVSNGAATFQYFDDFSTDKGWTFGGKGQISNGKLTKTVSGCSGSFWAIKSPAISFPSQGYRIRFRTQETSSGSCADTHLAGVGKSDGTPILDVGQYHTGTCNGKHVFATPPGTCAGQAAINTWYKYSGAFTQSGGTMTVYNSDDSVNAAYTTTEDAVTGAYRVGYGYFATGDLDDLFIATYVSPEPTWT
jgi:thermitase